MADDCSSANGYSLLEAAWRFARDRQMGRQFLDLHWRSQIVSDSPDCLALDDLQNLSDLRDIHEAELLAALKSGKLVAFWFLPGRTQPELISPAWWQRARIDLRLNQAQLDQTVITGLMISPAEPAQTRTEPATVKKRLRNRRSLYSESDAELYAEWITLVDGGTAPFKAAQMLATKADGANTLPESRAKRLYKRFTQSRISTQI